MDGSFLRRAALCLGFAACSYSGQPVTPTTGGIDPIPGVTDEPRTTATNESAPMHPLGVPVPVNGTTGTTGLIEGAPKTCSADADCKGSFNRCVKDVPDEVGICTKECSAHADCTDKAMWSCQDYALSDVETKKMCVLTCALNTDCPRGTSCNGGYCGTPCSGGNCTTQSCTSHYSVECMTDAVYWMNSCGDVEDLKQACASGETCVFGQCLTGGGTPSGGGPTGGTCSGSIYRCGSSSQVIEEDGCGHIKSTQTCSGGKECSGGMCRCGPSSQTRCISGKLWQLDSCGTPKSIQGSC